MFTANAIWHRAYALAFGSPDQIDEATKTLWHVAYKTRLAEDRRKMQQLAAARRLRATSAVHSLHLEVSRIGTKLRLEDQQLSMLKQDLSKLQRALHAEAMRPAHTAWQPVAVTKSLGAVVEQVPLEAEQQEGSLKQRIAESQLEVQKLRRQLAARQKALSAAQSRLQALQP